jgi:hypothetical protein
LPARAARKMIIGLKCVRAGLGPDPPGRTETLRLYRLPFALGDAGAISSAIPACRLKPRPVAISSAGSTR